MSKNLGPIFNIAFDCVSEPILLLDSDLKPILANQAFIRLLSDYTSSNIGFEDIENLISGLDAVNLSEPALLEISIKTYQEKVKVRISPLIDGFVLLKVITSYASEDLRRNLHSQRMETLGMLAGGVAHDFNNILTGLLGHVSYLKNILPQLGAHSVSIKALEEGTKRASSLTQEILKFARLETAEKPQPIELGDSIERTYQLLRGAIPPHFEITYELPEQPVIVLANEAKLVQVIINLVMNSKDAIEKGGFVKISLSVVANVKELQKVFGSKELAFKRYACIRVTDNGHGISKEVLKHIFEPYYTTKKDHGTGLGLVIVSEIVSMFSGGIEIQSKEGKGTIVSVYLPIFEELQETAGSKIKQEKKPPLARGSERILVVDDEFPVRNVISLSLEHLGYSVTMAASGEEAIELYQTSAEPYDLLIMDMLMPNMSGDQAFFMLKEIDPNVKVLLISGYSSPEAVESVLENGGLGFIAKPFTISDLSARVRQCLD